MIRRGTSRVPFASLFLTVGLLSGVGCSDGEEARLVVSAASSLTDAFTEIAAAFEEAHEDVAVDLNFGGSSALAVQIVEGAPADVFASANEAQMDVVVDAGLATSPARFAANRLVVAVPAGSAIETFEDLAASDVRLVLAGPDVPVGAYARAAIEAAGQTYGAGFADAVLANVVSEEPNVRAVLTRVELGEADAGIVYATDTVIAGDAVRAIEIPAEFAPPVAYVVAAVGQSSSSLAGEFVAFLLSSEGRAILARHGFGAAE